MREKINYNKKFILVLILTSFLASFGVTIYCLRTPQKNPSTQKDKTLNSFVIYDSSKTLSNKKDSSLTEIIKSTHKEKIISEDLFRLAYEEIKEMLEGRKEISFKRAVFFSR